MIAVVPIRGGTLPAGGAEAVSDAGGRALLAGEQPGVAAEELAGISTEVTIIELGAFAPGRWSGVLAPLLATEDIVVLPGSPDGRDLAPRLAHHLRRPLLAGAIEIRRGRAALPRWGGLVLEDIAIDGPVVATLQPGARGVGHEHGTKPATVDLTSTALAEVASSGGEPVRGVEVARDVAVIGVLPPDVTTMDLAEAPRILAGGAGLDAAGRFETLAAVAGAVGASVGATRVITDRGWIRHERQIGTTGVVVDPRLYIAFGISGAVQHTSGLGQPDHIISINTEPHCPMMQLADLGIVADANAVLEELAARLVTAADTAGAGGHA